jgi:L-ascorbate 6-phosphate lactonase
MVNLAQAIRETKVTQGSLAIFWLAQAGFVFKTSNDKVICVDPYLTDYVQRVLPEYGLGFKRMMASLLAPEEVEADYVISTHSHADHFDGDAMPRIAQNPHVRFIGAPDCRELYQNAGIPEERTTILHLGETLELGGCQVTGVFADHGDLAPDALGLWMDFGSITVWQVGDSAYRPDKWQDLFDKKVDVLLPPINGAFGNINDVDAAHLAADAHARVTIPCHFWMFPLHFGNPAGFLEACKQFAPKTTPLLMTQGECFIYQK